MSSNNSDSPREPPPAAATDSDVEPQNTEASPTEVENTTTNTTDDNNASVSFSSPVHRDDTMGPKDFDDKGNSEDDVDEDEQLPNVEAEQVKTPPTTTNAAAEGETKKEKDAPAAVVADNNGTQEEATVPVQQSGEDAEKAHNTNPNQENKKDPHVTVTVVEEPAPTKPRSVTNGSINGDATKKEEHQVKPHRHRGESLFHETDLIDHIDMDSIKFETERTLEKKKQMTAADRLHDVFLYLSIPSAIIVGAIAIGMYASDNVHAVTASRGVAGFATVCAVILTGFLMFLHMTVYTNPTQQRYIIRILLMVPIYAIDSFMALFAFKYGSIIALVRDTYEAYVIYMFFALLMDYLGGEDHVLQLWETQTSGKMAHLFPFTCILPEFKLNQRTLTVWKFCLVQYMILNPLLTLITIPLYFTGGYEEGSFSPGNSYVYFALIRFWSVTFAFTSLVYFFFATKDFLAPHKPLAKFAAIKTVVFLSFWQSVLIAGLNHFGVIPHGSQGLWTADRVATGLQNFIVCIEMYFVCLAHRWIFSDDPYIPLSGRLPLKGWVVKHAFSVRDVLEDSKETLLLSNPGTPKTGYTPNNGMNDSSMKGFREVEA